MAKFTLIDAPIEAFDDDCLGIGSYVDAMHRFIKGCETPLTIGIQGDWGIGKTSFLKMLIDKFSKVKGRETRCHTIYFNSWQYSQFGQEQSLSLSILRGIVADLQVMVQKGGDSYAASAKEKAEKFGTFVRTLGSQVIKAQTGVDLKAAKEAVTGTAVAEDIVSMITRTKDQFAELVAAVTAGDGSGDGRPAKLVIIIDDLDRLKPIRALEFLEAVKNFLDVPGCVFLLAVDYSVIQRGMEEKLGRTAQQLQGKSYFDKIIQVPFNMPTGAFNTEGYVMALLGWEKVKGKWSWRGDDAAYLRCNRHPQADDAAFLANVTRLTVGTNPRSIKRSISYATLLKIILLQSSKSKSFQMHDAKLLYALASLQLAWPEVFALLAENPVRETMSRLQNFDVFKEDRGLASLLRRVHNPDEVMSRVSSFLEELIGAIDEDGDGTVSRKEFAVIRDLMKRANLMAVAVEDLDEVWSKFSEMIRTATKLNAVPADVAAGLELLRADQSHWHDRLRLRLIPAGKRLVNVLWGNQQVGSLVTTQKEPLQFYLKCDPDALASDLGQERGCVADVRSEGHWGTGDSKVDLLKLAALPDGIDTLNRIHTVVVGPLEPPVAKAGLVAAYTFDGRRLKKGARVIANVAGDRIREGTGSTVACNIHGERIRDGTGSRVMFNLRGDVIREGTGGRRIARMRDVDDDIDGPGRVVKAALWLYFVR